MKKFEYKIYIAKYEDLADWDDSNSSYYNSPDPEIADIKKRISSLALVDNISTQEYVVLEELNSLGKEGWELILVIETKDSKNFYFKREM